MSTIGLVLFLLSLAGLLAVSWCIALEVARSTADRLWVVLASCAMLLGSTSVVASLFGWYTPAGFLAMQVVVSLAAWVAARACARRLGWRLEDGPDDGIAAPREPMRATEWALLVAIVLTVAPTLIVRIVLPVHHVDDLNYHASRAAYWVLNSSVLPYETHNERQTAFPFGAELVFAWPLLFTGGDLVGRLMYWLAYPLSVAGVFGVAKAVGASRAGALFAAMLYAVTPAAVTHATTLKSDLWTPVFVLGAGYWLARAVRDPSRAVAAFFWAGVFTALAMNVKVMVAAVVPVLALAPLVVLPWRRAMVAIVATGVGGLLATVLGGLAVVLIVNTVEHTHPLGPAYMRDAVQPEYSLKQTYTHAVRVPVFLFDLPQNPSHAARTWLTEAGNELIAFVGADEPLHKEDNPGWPGRFRFNAGQLAKGYGLGGMLWLPMLAVGLALAAAQAVRTFPRIRLSPIALLSLACVPLLLSVVFMIRWMGGGPERFWLAAYALSLAMGIVIFAPRRGAPKVVAVLAIIGAAWAVQGAAIFNLRRYEWASQRQPQYRFQPVVDAMPAGSTVLLVSTWNAEDYPLLAPGGVLTNHVVLWGNRQFDPESPAVLADLLEREDVQFVLFEQRGGLWQGGVGGLGKDRRVIAQPMIRWLLESAGAQPVELEGQTPALLLRLDSEGEQVRQDR